MTPETTRMFRGGKQVETLHALRPDVFGRDLMCGEYKARRSYTATPAHWREVSCPGCRRVIDELPGQREAREEYLRGQP